MQSDDNEAAAAETEAAGNSTSVPLIQARTYRFYKEAREGYTALIELVTDTVLRSQMDMVAHILEEHRRAKIAGHGVHVVPVEVKS